MGNLTNRLKLAQEHHNSWLCVGLDPTWERLPEAVLKEPRPFLAFCQAIVDATADLVCAFKPNLAFWLANGAEGIAALESVVAGIPLNVPVILDGKFGDVGHTAAAYARFAFDRLKVDATTINPYLGIDAARPFLEHSERGVFVLAKTSNPSAPDLQDQKIRHRPLYEHAARLAHSWDERLPGSCGLVVGATYPDELAGLREQAPDLPFLIPGIGAQGGNLAAAVAHGPSAKGVGPIVNSSRGIQYASSGPDFAQAARIAAGSLRDRINRLREKAL